MSSSEPIANERSADLTIAEAARAAGTGRHLIRTKLQAGAFPNSGKDAQGFWRIPEADLVAAGLTLGPADTEAAATAPAAATATADPETGEAEITTAAALAIEADEVIQLRVEILDLRHRAERAEALLEAERRLSEERARALEAERATAEALYLQLSGGRPRPQARPPEPPRGDWQASMRAARERDAQQRAARERASADIDLRTEPEDEPAGERDSVLPSGASAEPIAPDGERRSRWRRH